jgi:hypothetical protein
MRVTMRMIIAAGVLLATMQSAAALFSWERPQNAPWCLNAVFAGWVDCGYYSYRQCDAALSGLGGYCSENLWALARERRGRRGHSR